VRAWILYSGLRVGIFAVLFAVLYALTVGAFPDTAWAISGVAAALLAFCVSYIFLAPLRARVAIQVAEARAGTGRARNVTPGSDEDIEDTARGD
jgi:hypothetical protein